VLPAEFADTVAFCIDAGSNTSRRRAAGAPGFRPIWDVKLSQDVAVIGDAVAQSWHLPYRPGFAALLRTRWRFFGKTPRPRPRKWNRRREQNGFSFFAFGADVAEALAAVVAELTRT
jgi:hypothetical protein